jgi:hypothetical protein
MLTEPIAVTTLVTDALETLGVMYAICGSLASAVHGVMRATMDADLVADLRMKHIEPLAHALGDAFYTDVEMMFKVDVFVAKPREFDRSQLARRQSYVLSENPPRRAYITSAEDIVLAKLEWYHIGGRTSDRQWRDILGVMKVQKDRLDHDYLQRMATTLGMSDLLRKALDETT